MRISTGEFKSLTKLYFSASENGRRLKCEGDWYVEGSSKPRNLKFSIFLSGWDWKFDKFYSHPIGRCNLQYYSFYSALTVAVTPDC